jgi:hypothetical protein
MRFGISATSLIFPKNLRTRLRPVNVSAIVASRFVRRVLRRRVFRQAAIGRAPEACVIAELKNSDRNANPGNSRIPVTRFSNRFLPPSGI